MSFSSNNFREKKHNTLFDNFKAIQNTYRKNEYYRIPDLYCNIKPTDFNLKTSNSNNSEIFTNDSLYYFLCQTKELISKNEEEWNAIKKYTNPYEYIHTNYENNTCVCKIKPLSRAFFKFIEIFKTFELNKTSIYTPIKSFHLAEGPGGFIEAISKVRKCDTDVYYGMTLLDDENKNIPGWKKSQYFLRNNSNVVIVTGEKKNGDLYEPENYKYIYNNYRNSMNIITADGGFDFSVNYNNQEENAFRLIFTEILYALTLQKKDGTFILKVFDIFTLPTHQLMYLLTTFYDDVYIYKPYTSRMGNSEKYVVCKGFKYQNIDYLFKRFYNLLVEMNHIYNNRLDEPHIKISSLLNLPIPYFFKSTINEINAIFGQHQIENIHNTFIIIGNVNKKKEKLEYLKKENIIKCILWCEYHNLPYNIYQKNNVFLPK